ncbi:Alanyl-tRNA editing protein Aarsd1 [Geodia barretti]|nr:Alanyl-tRNA editing protein Aarsd1 [Geodia barretti]
MSLKCQKDSYLRSYRSRVASCRPAEPVGKGEGKYEVVLDDTVLFPEGGGQPYDRGAINGVEVLRVLRRGAVAVHFTEEPLEEGAEVEVEVDWNRRFDHMQQHSAQHLITAIADRDFGHKTTSWNLAIGAGSRCFVELAAQSVSPAQLRAIEDTCNEAIRSQIPMTPHWYRSGTPELERVRSRGLPDDFDGSEVRVVEIEGIDTNMCCGTHVSNLSHLQCIKLLHTESKKGSTLLSYIAGGRVGHYLERAYSNERTLNQLLSVSMDEHRESVEKLLKSNRVAAKVTRAQLREIAQLMAQLHLSSPSPRPFFNLHR